MAESVVMNSKVAIVNVGYRSTNFWVVSAGAVPPAGRSWLARDVQSPEDLKRRGMRLTVTEEQVSAIPGMKRYTARRVPSWSTRATGRSVHSDPVELSLRYRSKKPSMSCSICLVFSRP